MLPKTLQHVTLSTGHTRTSPRAEVASNVIAALRPLLESVLRGEHVPVPGSPGFTLSGAAAGKCCAVTLWAQASDAGGPMPVPVTTVGIAADGGCGAEFWPKLHAMTTLPVRADPAVAPSAPWCAAILHPGAAAQLQNLSWVADLERCLGWTWIEMAAECS